MRLTIAPGLVLFVAACSAAPLPERDAAVDDAFMARDAGPPITLGTTERPARIILPSAHDGTTRLPVVVLLHGYSVTSVAQDLFFHLSTVARERGFYLILPNGTVDSRGNPFWNAQPGCCNFDGSDVDDVAYLTMLLDQAEAQLPIDTTRVYFMGHSNGGYMSYRMACELGDRITAIAALAGADFAGETDCVPPRPVSVLHMHGTADADVEYDGVAGVFVGPVGATERWATRAGCDLSMARVGTPFDVDLSVAGAETTPTDHVTGCEGAVVSLWRMEGSSHVPAWPTASTHLVMDWLLARSAPEP
jgi:polyhydroxybutyrate depolymerase